MGSEAQRLLRLWPRPDPQPERAPRRRLPPPPPGGSRGAHLLLHHRRRRVVFPVP